MTGQSFAGMFSTEDLCIILDRNDDNDPLADGYLSIIHKETSILGHYGVVLVMIGSRVYCVQNIRRRDLENRVFDMAPRAIAWLKRNAALVTEIEMDVSSKPRPEARRAAHSATPSYTESRITGEALCRRCKEHYTGTCNMELPTPRDEYCPYFRRGRGIDGWTVQDVIDREG